MGDLDFADGITLLLHTQEQMKELTILVSECSARLGLNIHRGKSTVLTIYAANKS
jgi:hypothetical protein